MREAFHVQPPPTRGGDRFGFGHVDLEIARAFDVGNDLDILLRDQATTIAADVKIFTHIDGDLRDAVRFPLDAYAGSLLNMLVPAKGEWAVRDRADRLMPARAEWRGHDRTDGTLVMAGADRTKEMADRADAQHLTLLKGLQAKLASLLLRTLVRRLFACEIPEHVQSPHKRIPPDRAEDLLQGFVTCKIVERDCWPRRMPARGRFRSFLLKSLEHYVIDELRRAAGRGEARADEETCEVPSPPTADVFEVEWARQLLQEALRRMRRSAKRKAARTYGSFSNAGWLAPALHGCPPPPYLELVARFGFRSAEQASNALVTAKRQFERNLGAVIAETERVSERQGHPAGDRRPLQNPQQRRAAGRGLRPRSDCRSAGPEQEDISAVDESNPEELACLLSVRGTAGGELAARGIGRHLATLPGSRLPANIWRASARTGRQSLRPIRPRSVLAVGMTLGELFQCADPPLGLLIAVKRVARRLMGPGASDVPVEVHRLIYFASIAAALVRHGEQISKSSPEVLRVAWERLAAESYVDDGLRRLFGNALEKTSNLA